MNHEADEPEPRTYEVHQGEKKHLLIATAYRVRDKDQILTFYGGSGPTHVFRDWDHFMMLPVGHSDHLVC